MTKEDLLLIRHSRVVTDPFPAHSFYEALKQQQSKLEKFFHLSLPGEEPEAISIWKAYRMGYEKAYAEIAAACE